MQRRTGRKRLAVIAMLWCLSSAARADTFSPGELARCHASLEGLRNCTRCHERGEELSAQRCVACHEEIGSQLTSNRGFHGRLPAGGQKCESCHHEHQGRDAALIDWGPRGQAGFEHASTGYPLRGKHAAAACTACHQPRRVKDAGVAKRLADHPGMRTFLGLEDTCTACHFDEHRGQMKAACESCHDERGWRPAPGFNHARTGFALKGAHRRVGCAKCHGAVQDTATAADAFPPPVSMRYAKLGELPHAACTDCHADPHKGQFKQRCESCHSVESWHQVHKGAADPGFHDRTRFPLRGAHAQADCRACHGPFPGQRARFRGLPFATCTECHADAHPGQIAEPRTGPTCDRCHGLDAFLPARFEVEDHAKTRYPLEGAHQVAACNGCHVPLPALAQRIPVKVKRTLEKHDRPLAFSLALFELMPRTSRCDGCHKDPHGGQFRGKQGRTACAECHQVQSFHAVAFDHDKDTAFPLTGKHRAAQCSACHAGEKPGQPERYRGTPAACERCHADVHAGQFAAAPDEPTGCARCHTTADFKATSFQHAPPFTDFLLKGKHAAVACARCHPEVKVPGPGGAAVAVQRFKPLPRTCAGCHEDAHQGSFRGLQP